MARLGASIFFAPSTSRPKVEIFCVVMLKGATVTPERKTGAADSWNLLPVAVRVACGQEGVEEGIDGRALEPELVVGKGEVVGADDGDGGDGALTVDARFDLADVVGESTVPLDEAEKVGGGATAV
jgi:hypothetical protein